MIFKSPYPWPGGKSVIMPDVWRRFGGNIKNFVDPFMGSNAPLLSNPYWTPDGDLIESVNDADGFVSNFWRAVSDDPDAVAAYADWPVNENDLHARHIWLVGQRESMTERLEGDPLWYDAKIAGWWVWGMACWIGSGFCSGKGPWWSADGKMTKTDGGQGVNRQRVHLGDGGQGVSRQMVHLGNVGNGVNRKMVHLGNGLGAGDGSMGIYEWMESLQRRLKRVRVCCGDWSRVTGAAATTKHGLTAVFLDPPYSKEAGRDMGLYAVDSGTVAYKTRQWALDNGDNPLLRIALCGYEREHDMPGTWERLYWSTNGGYGNQSDGRGRDNKHREVIWFSPHCIKPLVGGNGRVLPVTKAGKVAPIVQQMGIFDL